MRMPWNRRLNEQTQRLCTPHTCVLQFGTFLSRKMTKFEVMWRMRAPDDEFSILSTNVKTVHTNFISCNVDMHFPCQMTWTIVITITENSIFWQHSHSHHRCFLHKVPIISLFATTKFSRKLSILQPQ